MQIRCAKTDLALQGVLQKRTERVHVSMNKMEDFLTATKLNELLHKREVEEKNKNTVLWILAIIGAVAAVAGIAYAVLGDSKKRREYDQRRRAEKRTKEKRNYGKKENQQKKKANPIDTTELFEKFMGIKR